MNFDQTPTNPPGSLTAFVAIPCRSVEGSSPRSSCFRLSCAGCGSERFALEELLSGEHPAGVDSTCIQCGRTESLFRAARDGYDGRLGHLAFLQEITNRRPLVDFDQRPVGAVIVACEFGYSVDPEELASTANDQGLSPVDLFDGFAIAVSDAGANRWRYVWEYECA